MPFRYLGVTHDAGVSKKTGRSYDMCRVLVASDAKAARRADRKAAHGFEQDQFDLDPNAIGQFARVQPFSLIDLQFEPNPNNPRINWVVGIKAAAQEVKSA